MPRNIRRPHAPAFPEAVRDIIPRLEELNGQTLYEDSVIALPLGDTAEKRIDMLRFLTGKGYLQMKSIHTTNPDPKTRRHQPHVFVRFEWRVL